MSNENKIRILYVQPGKYPEEQLVANELHPLQRLVGGYMQAVYPWSKDKVALICNDSGKVDGLPLNRCIEDYDVIAGNFLYLRFFRGGILQLDRQTVPLLRKAVP